MGFDIQRFSAHINQAGAHPLPTNRFSVVFPPPPVLQSEIRGARPLEFWCDSVLLPGGHMYTDTYRRYTYGPDEKRPMGMLYSPLICTFVVDGRMNNLTYFHMWQQHIITHNWYNSFNQTGYNGAQYEVAYKKDYATDLSIQVYHSDGILIKRYLIKEAFPAQIFDLPLSWNETNTVARIQVNFEYIDWIEDNMKATGEGIPSPDPFAPTQFNDRYTMEDLEGLAWGFGS
jgi:hypothetical protein